MSLLQENIDRIKLQDKRNCFRKVSNQIVALAFLEKWILMNITFNKIS